MTASNWLTLFGIAVAAVVALAVAALHRKQMRQIELHRTDPTIPLVPPPHPITRFLRSYGFNTLFYGWCLGWAIHDAFRVAGDLRETTPVTRDVVFQLVFDIVATVLLAILGVQNLISDMQKGISNRRHRWTIDVVNKLADKIADLEKREK
jgi:hypothetical protein